MVDEQKLRQLAEAATPGPWFVVGQPWNPKADFIVAGSPDPHMGQYVADTEDFDGEGQNVQENAEWIASANPAAILSLLDELQTLREERTAWRVTAENAEALVADFRKQNEVLTKDAERYQWLCSFSSVSMPELTWGRRAGIPKNKLDTAIDAAMKDES